VAGGYYSGFKPWEKIILLLSYFLPAIAFINLFAGLAVPWTPCISALLLLIVLRRASVGKSDAIA
jgi:hypothetical protein